MDKERENQIDAIYIGTRPSDFVGYIERTSIEKILADIGETGELIKLTKDDLKYTPIEKYSLYKNVNRLIKAYAKLKFKEKWEEFYEKISYEFYATNTGIKVLRCDEKAEEGWLPIT